MQLDQVFHDREPQASAARIAPARFVDTIEALEYPREIFFGDARPFIGHGHRRPAVDRPRFDEDRALFGRVGDGVGHEVAKDVMKFGRVGADHRGIGRDRHFDTLPAFLRGRLEIVDDSLDQQARIAGHEIERLLPGVEPREPKEILDQPLHPQRLPADDLEESPPIVRVRVIFG